MLVQEWQAFARTYSDICECLLWVVSGHGYIEYEYSIYHWFLSFCDFGSFRASQEKIPGANPTVRVEGADRQTDELDLRPTGFFREAQEISGRQERMVLGTFAEKKYLGRRTKSGKVKRAEGEEKIKKGKMVAGDRIELPTRGFSILCSTN